MDYDKLFNSLDVLMQRLTTSWISALAVRPSNRSAHQYIERLIIRQLYTNCCYSNGFIVPGGELVSYTRRHISPYIWLWQGVAYLSEMVALFDAIGIIYDVQNVKMARLREYRQRTRTTKELEWCMRAVVLMFLTLLNGNLFAIWYVNLERYPFSPRYVGNR